jgi:hypothetical protein
MARALQDAEEFAEGAHGFVVLDGEDAGELVEMGEVVDSPRGEEFGEGELPECWMPASLCEVSGCEVPPAQFD